MKRYLTLHSSRFAENLDDVRLDRVQNVIEFIADIGQIGESYFVEMVMKAIEFGPFDALKHLKDVEKSHITERTRESLAFQLINKPIGLRWVAGNFDLNIRLCWACDKFDIFPASFLFHSNATTELLWLFMKFFTILETNFQMMVAFMLYDAEDLKDRLFALLIRNHPNLECHIRSRIMPLVIVAMSSNSFSLGNYTDLLSEDCYSCKESHLVSSLVY